MMAYYIKGSIRTSIIYKYEFARIFSFFKATTSRPKKGSNVLCLVKTRNDQRKIHDSAFLGTFKTHPMYHCIISKRNIETLCYKEVSKLPKMTRNASILLPYLHVRFLFNAYAFKGIKEIKCVFTPMISAYANNKQKPF